jgi:hypothetical protein
MKLKSGQYSPVITVLSPPNRLMGFRVVKLVSKEPAGQRELTDPRVQQPIRSQIHDHREQLLRAAHYEVLRDSTKVENYYAKKVLNFLCYPRHKPSEEIQLKKSPNGYQAVRPESDPKAKPEPDILEDEADEAELHRRQDLHDQHKARICEDIQSSTDSFDQSLLTLSSGALGVSLAFIKDIVPLKEAVWIGLLFASWIAFALCIVTTVVSFLLSVKANKQQLGYIDEYYLHRKDDALDKHKTSGYLRWLQRCTWVAIILFVAGLFCTIIFACENVARFRMSDDKVKGTPVKIDQLHGGREPVDMTPVAPVKPVPTPAPAKQEGRGRQPVDLTPVKIQEGRQPLSITPTGVTGLEKGRPPLPVTPVKPVQPAPTPSSKPSGSS